MKYVLPLLIVVGMVSSSFAGPFGLFGRKPVRNGVSKVVKGAGGCANGSCSTRR